MNRKRRTDLEIKRDMLKVIQNTVGITEIVYQANLNFVIVHRHLIELSQKGLIKIEPHEQNEDRKTYSLTNEGIEIIPQIEMVLF